MKHHLFICTLVALFAAAIPLEWNGTMEQTTDPHGEASTQRILSRKKRYLVFPQGSSFSVAACLVTGIYGNPEWTFIGWGLNWGIALYLPNETYEQYLKRESLQKELEATKSVTQRRHRRSLYGDLELIIDHMGFNGRQCILRALCESAQLFNSKSQTMVKELLRTAFSMPKARVLHFEPSDLMDYDEAYRKGLKSRLSCARMFDCRFSLHALALGRYSEPPKEPDEAGSGMGGGGREEDEGEKKT